MEYQNTIVALLLEEEEEEAVIISQLTRDETHDVYKRRVNEGAYTQLIKKYLIDDETKFREYFRVSRDLFYRILASIKDDISTKTYNRVTCPITAEEKLSITLRFMATRESYRSLKFQFRVSHSWISKIIKDTLKAITDRMMRIAIPEISEDLLFRVSEAFAKDWDFPNCIGAIDGKHIRVKCPKNSGSLYFNYKDYFSIVLLALVDSKCKFLAIDIGSYGKEGDAGIFAKSNIGKALAAGNFPFPSPKALQGNNILPHVLLGDEAFQLTSYMMRPFPREQARTDEKKAIFNLRLCRARRTTENAFGILCQYFRVFFTPIAIAEGTADYLVTAACIIHNLLRDENIPYPTEDVSSKEHRTEFPKENLISLKKHATNASTDAYRIREEFMNYFCSSQGMLSWQVNRVRRTH